MSKTTAVTAAAPPRPGSHAGHDIVPVPANASPAGPGLPAHIAAATTSDSALTAFLHSLPAVDPVGLEARIAVLGTRSIKKDSKLHLIDLAISMVDLTTLEGADTAGKVKNLCRKALLPDPDYPDTPRTAAICVYPDLVETAVTTLAGSGIKVASVATAFPAGRSSLEVKLADIEIALKAGADEIDMVIDRGAFLSGNYAKVFEEIAAAKAACGKAVLKVILETGELGTYDGVRRASWLALLAGADFIKTSTGKVSPAATLPVTCLMLQAVKDWHELTGQRRSVKAAGGIRTTKDAIKYLVMVNEIAGPAWLNPDFFRFGASGVVNDLIMQRRTQREGHYSGPGYVTLD